jgi:hypothetical protein
MYAERTDICTSFAADVEDGEMAVIVEFEELLAVNGTDTKLTLDGRNERRALEEGAGQDFQGARELCLATGKLVVEANNGDILLSCTLLRLDETGCPVNANDKAASNFGIESSAVPGLLTSVLC